jgi:hypothetical protein
VKPIGDDGDLGLPGTREYGRGTRLEASDDVLVPIEDDFDIGMFPSEAALGGEEAAPVATPALAADEPAAAELTAPELAAPDLLQAEPDAKAAVTPVVPPAEAASLLEPGPQIGPKPSPGAQKTPALSIAELLDNHVRLEWHEAVAIALHLCDVMSKEPGANVHRSLVEPWNVEITNTGDVHVLPFGSSSDPLVKQVGRVLRALLQDSIAPAELRLVASQASFDVPVYASVEVLAAALKRFDQAGNVDAIRAAFNRGLEAKFAAHVTRETAAPVIRPAPAQAHAPARRAAVKTAPPRAPEKSLLPARLMFGGAAAVVALMIAGFALSRVIDMSGLASVGSSTVPVPRVVVTPPQPPPPPENGLDSTRHPPAPVRSIPAVPDRRAAPPASHLAPGAPARESLTLPTVVPDSFQPTPAAGESLEAAEQRAGALFAEGRTEEAVVFFDGIVMKNPLYQLDPLRSTPEALAAFQASKRRLLPAITRRYYQEARMAYDAGDFSMTLAKGERALTLLRDVDLDPSDAGLSGEVTDLMALATAARTLEESRIYTKADRDVTPPRPIGRQLSTASLSGKSPLTGRLELVVGRTGEVETVKLDTPVNGYHDRMIVSAAKAWHYRPALRKGHAVRYSMVMSITLPDF